MSLIMPHLKYESPMWDDYQQHQNDPVERVSKEMLCFTRLKVQKCNNNVGSSIQLSRKPSDN